jgi:hypothetical protein
MRGKIESVEPLSVLNTFTTSAVEERFLMSAPAGSGIAATKLVARRRIGAKRRANIVD